MVFAPAVVEVKLQVPVATAALQVSVPSLTVTVPVGVPTAGLFTVVLQLTAYAWPGLVGVEPNDTALVITVVVSPLFTVCDVVPAVLVPTPLALKFPSPL